VATKARILAAASASFADRGYEAVSLDALAGDIGITKQTILYHFGSKPALLDAVVAEAVAELIERLERAVDGAPPGWDRVEAVVRAAFALAVRRPALLGLLREVSRLGPPASTAAIVALRPLVDRALAGLSAGMADGTFRRSDPRLVLVWAYAAVAGVVTDGEAMRAVGLELDLRSAARLRSTVLTSLRATLLPPPPPIPNRRL
jgi:TetR/AcrR family transcriptional regulator